MNGLRTRQTSLFATLLLFVGFTVGCATSDPSEPPPPLTPTDSEPRHAVPNATHLLPIQSWPVDLGLRQRVRIQWGETPAQAARFDAVLEKKGPVLLLVGLDPLARPGFVLRAEADSIAVSNRSGRALPFEPAHMLADVQRVFYPWDTKAVPADILLTETVGVHGLVSRRFERRSRPEDGAILVTFEGGWLLPYHVPRRAIVQNGWHGYTLEVETLEATALPATTDGAKDDTKADTND